MSPLVIIRAKKLSQFTLSNTRKRQKWFWGEIIPCCISDDWPLQD